MRVRALLRRVALLTLVLLAGAAGTFAVAMIVHRKGLDWSASAATVGAFVVAILALFSPTFRSWWNGAAPVSQLSLDEAVERVSQVLLAQWLDRNNDRQVYDPGAMRVQFKVTRFTRSLMTTVPVGGGPESRGDMLPDDLSGSFDNILEIFGKVQRLVITGPAGSGKSVLVSQLACELSDPQKARSRKLTENRLPVILQASAWKPRESLSQWIASELIRIDQELSRRPRGATGKRTTLAQLMAASRVIPIIDGIDELPRRLRAEAIRRINEAGSNRPLVVTSRPAEYSAALAAAGREISRAAVVAMLPLSLPTVRAYLREAAIPRSVPRWQLVFQQLELAPGGPLAAALTNPLLLWLCRRIYSQGDRDPAELAGRPDLGHLRAIEKHLFGAFLPAIYRSNDTQPSPWTTAQARQWLGFLAGSMEQSWSSDLAWWRLRTTVTGWRPLSMLVRGAALSVLACWLAVWVLRRAGDWQNGSYSGRAGIGKLLFNGPAAQAIRLAFDRLIVPLYPPERPVPKARTAPPDWSFNSLRPILHLAPWPLYAIILGTIAFNYLSFRYDRGGPVTFRLTHSLARTLAELVGLMFAAAAVIELILHIQHWPPTAQGSVQRGLFQLAAIVIAVVFLPGTFSLVPTELYGSKNPVSVLHGDRMAYVLGAAVLLIPFTAVWSVCGTAIGVAAGALGVAYLLSELLLGSSASGAFVETRAWLALTRRMPLRALAFLEDAHQRGALARTGSTYQFRHLQLQRYLARDHGPRSHRFTQSRFASWILASFYTEIPSSTEALTHALWARAFAAQADTLANSVGRCEPTGPVYRESPGVVQRFGTADGRDWTMCAMPGRKPVLVADSLWSLLHEVRADADNGDALRLLGFPTLPAKTPAAERLITAGTVRLALDGGTWGPSVLERSADRGWRWRPHDQLVFTEQMLSRRRNKGVRMDLRVTLPCTLPELVITRQLAQKLKGRLSASDLVSVMESLSLPDQVRRVTASASYKFRWRAAIGSLPAVAVITVFPRSRGLEVQVGIDITAGGRPGTGIHLGVLLEPLQAMLQAGWQAAADVIPGAIVSDLPESLTGRPQISLSMSTPSTPEEILRLGPGTNTRKFRYIRRGTFTRRTVTISGSVVGLTKAERDRRTRDALASLMPRPPSVAVPW